MDKSIVEIVFNMKGGLTMLESDTKFYYEVHHNMVISDNIFIFLRMRRIHMIVFRMFTLNSFNQKMNFMMRTM